MKNVILALFLIALTSQSFAAEMDLKNLSADERKALTIGSVEVTPLEEFDKGTVELPTPGTVAGDLNEISIIIDSILAIGKKIWPIIEAGRPVISDKLAPPVSIVPHLQDANAGVLYEMENWSIPKSMSVRVSYKNLLGMEVVGFTYTVLFQYNGSYNNVGQYVTGLAVVASDIYTAWGFNFDANSELISIANVGTKYSPVASGNIKVSYKVTGKLNEARTASVIYVDGSGRIQLIGQ